MLWLWQFVRVRTDRRALLIYLGLAAAVVVTLAAANARTSGCPFYPSQVGCSSGESSVGSAFAASMSKEVRDYAAQGNNRHMAWFLAAALAATAFALKTLWGDPVVLHGLAASWSGIVFIMVTAPNPRFGMGYLLLPVAIALASFVQWLYRRWPALLSASRASLPLATAAVTLAFLVLSFHAPNSRFSLLLPKRMASADGDPIHIVNQKLNTQTTLSLIKAKLGDVLVVCPASSDQCWDAALPCTGETWQHIELRDPAQGLRGGFRWSSTAQRRNGFNSCRLSDGRLKPECRN
jgi:hypothetical protein